MNKQKIEPVKKFKKIGLVIHDNPDEFVKKFMKIGMSKRRAEDLYTDFWEIERFCLGFKDNMSNILKSKDKKGIREELDDLQSELCTHIIPHHFLTARTTLMKAGFDDYDILPELTDEIIRKNKEQLKRLSKKYGVKLT